MKVSSKDIYLDTEDEYIAVSLELVKLDKEHEGPRWFFLVSEWVIYVSKRVSLNNRLRKLKEQMGYNTCTAE